MNKYLFIHLEVQDGTRRHDHRVLHITKAKNINFAAERYVSTFWGYSSRPFKGDWWYTSEISLRLKRVVKLTKSEYKLLERIMYEL
ncbi:MAG TPA: hypothetical protein P5513_01755 [Candidatus Diapherotrites archaeon]|nr:hypothetical protein [Candidatus Diapherotrites archaeon]